MPLCRTKFILLLWTLGLSLSLTAHARTSFLKLGLQHYAKGEFEKAAQELQKALKQKPGKTDKTKIYKYIGLSVYTLGRQAEAAKNFELCLDVSSSCSIDRKEALDESVLPFFRDLKKRHEEQKRAPKAKTRILVKSPVKSAEILIDGILVGNANVSLEARPGTRDITVQAKGYKSRRLKIAISKLVENVYEIDLEKTDKKSRKKKDRDRDKVPPVLPTEDEVAKNLKDPALDSEKKSREKKESLDLPEDKGPPPPPPAPVELVKTPVSIAHFLPLGVGQFYNGDYLLGTVFLGAQLYAAGVIVVANQDIQKAQDNQAASIRNADLDPTITQDDIDKFTADTNDFVKQKQERINIALGVAAGTYVFGVVHALINRPYVLPNAAADGSSKPGPQLVGFHLQPTGDQGLKLQWDWNF